MPLSVKGRARWIGLKKWGQSRIRKKLKEPGFLEALNQKRSAKGLKPWTAEELLKQSKLKLQKAQTQAFQGLSETQRAELAQSIEREYSNARRRHYLRSPKGSAATKAFNRSPRGRATKRRWRERHPEWKQDPRKALAYVERYNRTPKGVEVRQKSSRAWVYRDRAKRMLGLLENAEGKDGEPLRIQPKFPARFRKTAIRMFEEMGVNENYAMVFLLRTGLGNRKIHSMAEIAKAMGATEKSAIEWIQSIRELLKRESVPKRRKY